MSVKRLSKDLEKILEEQKGIQIKETKLQKVKNFFEKIYEEIDYYVFDKIKTFYCNQKHYRNNKKRFKNLLKNHRDWDYDSFFEFMDVFLEGQINLEPTFSLNRHKLVKKLKVLKELNKRIREDDYIHQVMVYNPDAKNFNEVFQDKPYRVFSKNDYFKQRQSDLDYYTHLLNKTILQCWE